MAYILYHLELAWAFVRGRDEALYQIDATPRGLKLSFLAILIAEPIGMIYAILFGFHDRILLFREGGFAYYLLQLFLDWGMAPLIYFLICGTFGYRDRLIPLIVSHNWLSVVTLVITLVPGAFMTSGLAGDGLSLLIMLGIYSFVFWISYRLYRCVLDCEAGQAFGLASLMLVLGMTSIALLARLTMHLG